MGKRKRATRIAQAALAFVLGVGGAAAAEAWQSQPSSEWTQEEALAVLRNSPWAQRVTLLQLSGRTLGRLPDGRKVVYRERPELPPRIFSVELVGLEPERVEAVYEVRWSSAAIVQQAFARLEELEPVLANLQAPPPELSPEHYVLTARVAKPPVESGIDRMARGTVVDEMGRPRHDSPPQVADIFAGLSEEELRERAELRSNRGLRLKPDRVLRHGIGAGEGISFFFPRQHQGRPSLPAGTAWAELRFKSKKGDTLKARFQLSALQVNGQPDY
ncbi:MAG: hypothetical protein ACE5MH_07685 [Terriglobia bacterium]